MVPFGWWYNFTLKKCWFGISTHKKRLVVKLPGALCVKNTPPMWFLEFAVSLPSKLPNKGGLEGGLLNCCFSGGSPGFILRPDEDKGRGSKGRKGLRSSAATTNSESWTSKATTSSEWSTKAEGQWNSQWVPKESKDTPLEVLHVFSGKRLGGHMKNPEKARAQTVVHRKLKYCPLIGGLK